MLQFLRKMVSGRCTTLPQMYHTDPVVPQRPTAFVYCHGDLYFSADFIVGMTLKELVRFLQDNCSYRSIDVDPNARIPWLPKILREADTIQMDLDYIIKGGDIISMSDRSLPDATLRKLAHEK